VSELIIVGYDDHDTARKAYEQIISLQNDYVVDLAKPFGGEVLQTSLSAEDDTDLAEGLSPS
jgi:uncharacterized membrane protein